MLSVTWRLLDSASGQAVASDMISETSPNFPLDLPSPSEDSVRSPETRLLHDRILALALRSIRDRLLPKPQTVQVYLAKGNLSEGCNLGKSGRWNDALEFFLRVPVFPKPKDDSYRLYNLGIAHEALAYSERRIGNVGAFLKHVEESKRFLTEALRLNPGEKIYAAAQARVAEWHTYVTTQ